MKHFWVIFVVVCFFMTGCAPDGSSPPDCPPCDCPTCPSCQVCEECPECPVCEECPVYEECPVCEECPDNPLAGEYSIYILNVYYESGEEITYPTPKIFYDYDLGVNVSMQEEVDFDRFFFMDFSISLVHDAESEEMEGFYFSGSYSYDSDSLFVENDDGELLWFDYDTFVSDGVSYLELFVTDFREEGTESRLLLQRNGNPNECGMVGRDLGHCYSDNFCLQRISGCYTRDTCRETGGAAWRSCNFSSHNPSHDHDGYCLRSSGG